MNIKTAFVSLLVIFLLSAFIPQPAPLYALPLPEGRTLDEGHNSGFIDWSGGVGYANLFHRDGICPSGCNEMVTQISSGGTVSGAFAGDVSYFEVMLAYSGAGGFGTATIQACSSAYSVYLGIGGATPGFNSFSLSVPSGCTSWSVSASGGVVYFRSVDANYSYIPPTSTFTPIPTETFPPTGTMTPLPTDTETPSPTATETLVPGITPSETPTPSDTPSPTLTSTPSQTLPPGVTPSDTPTATITPVPPLPTNTPVPSSGGGGVVNPPIIPFVSFPTATQVRSAPIVPTGISETPTSQPYSVVALPSVAPTETLPLTSSAASAQAPMPWLPIAAAAALGTSAVVASRTETGKVSKKQPGGISQRFPANPIPFSLFPKSPGSGKAVASYRLDGGDPPPPLPPPEPPEEGDEGDTGVVATSTPIAPGGPQVVPTRAPIAPGTPPIKPIVIPKIPEEVLLEAGGVGTSAANAMADYDDLHQQRGIERIAALIDNAKSFSLKSAFSNLLNEEWVAGKLEKTLVQTAEKLIPQNLIDDLNLWAGGKIPFGEVVSNLGSNTLKRVDDGLNRGSIATALMSIAGTTMSALGIKQGETISDIGTVGGAFVDAGSMLTGAAKLFQAAKTGFYPTAGALGKVAGALAIPLGLFVGFTEGAAAIKDYQQNGQLTNDGKASAWNSAGGFLTAAGGVALLIPGGQIVGGILLAAGGVCSGISWYFQNKEKVDAFVKNTWTSASTAVSKAVTNVKNTVNKAVTTVKNTVNQSINTARTKIADTVTKVTDAAAKTITVVGQNISKAVTKVAETTAKVVKVVGEKIAAAVTKVTETASKAITNTASAAAKLVSKVSPAAAEKIVQASQAVSKAVRDAGQAVAKTVTKVTETASKAISSAGQTVSKAVNTATQKAAETVKSIGNTISNWFKKKP